MPSLMYGQKYQILSGYEGFSGGYLTASSGGCYSNLRAMGDNLNCVSTMVYPEQWTSQKYGDGSLWKIISATGRTDGSPVMFNDIIYLRAGFPPDQKRFGPDAGGGYLETRGYGCQDNLLCVSTGPTPKREASWKILLTEPGGGGVQDEGEVQRGSSEIHLQNGFDDWKGGYLDTRGEGCQGNKLCVSTRENWNRENDGTTWKFVAPGQFT